MLLDWCWRVYIEPFLDNIFMIIGIDASRYSYKEATGVEWYSYYLLNELIPLLGREHHSEIRLYGRDNFHPDVDLPFNVRKRVIPLKRFWTVLGLSFEMLRRRPDVLFVPSHTLPFFAPKKSIITIHDVAFLHLKKAYSWFEAWRLHQTTKKAVKKAYRLIVPSEATKHDLVKFYHCNLEKIVVIPHGAPHIPALRHWGSDKNRKLRCQFFLSENDLFVLYVGRLEAKKNLERLIAAFHRFLAEFPDWKLILAGKRGTGFEEIMKTVLRLKLEQNVIMPGYVTEKEKSFLFEHCRIFAFPSLYEGFGLPLLEAFSYHKPVLAGKIPALLEVGGNAAYFVNPAKVEEIGVGLKRLAQDGLLVTKIVQNGTSQLKKFSWEKAAQETFEVIFG